MRCINTALKKPRRKNTNAANNDEKHETCGRGLKPCLWNHWRLLTFLVVGILGFKARAPHALHLSLMGKVIVKLQGSEVERNWNWRE